MHPKEITQKLYIIGNGFDIYHGLNTKYSSFGLFLKKIDRETYEYLLKYLYLPNLRKKDKKSLDDPMWWQFENSLAGLDMDEVLEEFSEFSANPGADDFSDGDWDTIAVYISEIKKYLHDNLISGFKKFIQNVSYPELKDLQILSLDNRSKYLNFNYTNTLEHYYNISSDQILYIHNKANGSHPLILGHGFHPGNFKSKEPNMPDGLSLEEQAEWMDFQSNNFDLSIENGRDELVNYFEKSFKSTDKIITQNISFFDSLKLIDEVNVLGHSISMVDHNYFKKIIETMNNDKVTWNVTYFKESEKLEKQSSLISLGLKPDQINLCTMDYFK